MTNRKPYPTDLTDDQWERLEPFLPPAKPHGRPRATPLRELLDAYWYVLRAGCAWRLLPHDFPPWQTVYSQIRRWKHDGVWPRLHGRLAEEVRLAEGRPPEPSAAVLDSQTVKAGNQAGARGYDAPLRCDGQLLFADRQPPALRRQGLRILVLQKMDQPFAHAAAQIEGARSIRRTHQCPHLNRVFRQVGYLQGPAPAVPQGRLSQDSA